MLLQHFSRWIVALMIAIAAAGMSFNHAAAAPAGGADKPGANVKLTQAYRVERLRLRVQGKRLRRADQFTRKFDALIVKLKAKAQDTSALEQALAAFRASLDRARTEWNAAQSTLDSHAGFDTNGKVTNADQAHTTLQRAHDYMEQAHMIAKAAFRDLRTAFVAFRKAHRNVPDVPAPQEP